MTDAALTLTAVPADAVERVWTKAEPLLAKAVERSSGRYTEIDILHELLTGRLGLWLVLEGAEPIAAMTSMIELYPRKKVLVLDWAGGERLEEWLPLAHEVFTRYAKANGCTEAQCRGRKGWERVLRTHGFTPDFTVFTARL